MIAETCSFDIGPFKIQQRPRFDNPAFAVYIVSRGDRQIGKSFSRPDLACCEWLERQNGVYAGSSSKLLELTGSRRESSYLIAKRRRTAIA